MMFRRKGVEKVSKKDVSKKDASKNETVSKTGDGSKKKVEDQGGELGRSRLGARTRSLIRSGSRFLCTLLAGYVIGAKSCDEYRDHEAYQENIGVLADLYRTTPLADEVGDRLLVPGSGAGEISTTTYFGQRSFNESRTVIVDGHRIPQFVRYIEDLDSRESRREVSHDGIGLLPSGGGQVVKVESRVIIDGMRGYDLSSFLGAGTGVYLELDLSEVIPHSFSIEEVRVLDGASSGPEIPLDYVRGSGDTRFIDIKSAVEDGVFDVDSIDDLALKIVSRVDIEEVRPVVEGDVLGVDAIPQDGSLDEYLGVSWLDSPPGMGVYDGVVAMMGVEDPSVLDIMRYGVRATGAILEYVRGGNNLYPGFMLILAGEGNCVDYTELFIDVMRSFGVPARYASGDALDYSGDFLGGHAWAEVYVPFRDGGRWVMVDPTWADGADDNRIDDYIGMQSSRHVYPFDINARLSTYNITDVFRVLEHHALDSCIVPRDGVTYDPEADLCIRYGGGDRE